MNRTYRLKWNDGRHAWIPVGENARTRGSRAGARALRRLGAIAVAGVVLALPPAARAKSAADVAANALPTGFELRAGIADVPRTVGNEMTLKQHSQRVVYSWKGFDVGTAASVVYDQKVGDMALNIIGGNDPSYILGALKAPGTVFFVNPNGMYFGKGASINVGGMLATTMSMDPDEFMNGRYRLTSPGKGQISNESVITAAGSVALVGNDVQNSGTIVATSVTLASGNAVAIDLTGDGLIRARVEDPALKASIVNSGTISAVTAVTLTAGQARDTLDRIVNNTGVIRATGLAERGGEIVLEGGLVSNSGTLDASSLTGAGGSIGLFGRDVTLAASSVVDVSGATSGGTIKVLGDMEFGQVFVDGHIYARGGSGDGGFVETSAAQVGIADSFRIHALSAMGLAGKWLIDPLDFYISAGTGARTSSGIGATTLSNALEGADVTIATDDTNSAGGNYGDIYVNSAVSWSAATTLTLNAYRNINVNDALTASGNGSIKLRADSTGTGTGTVSFSGAGHATTNGSGRTDIYYNPAGGYNGANKSDSTHDPYSSYVTGTHAAWMLVNKIGDLFSAGGTYGYNTVNDDLDGYYAMGRNIDFSGFTGYGSGFRPIGTYNLSTYFTGRFDGLDHTISNLSITGCGSSVIGPCNNSNAVDIGLFSQTSSTAVIQNLGLVNVTVDNDGNGNTTQVGTLVGVNLGTIRNSYATGQIGSSGRRPRADTVGGLVGSNAGTIDSSYANVRVYGSSYVGGLVGNNSGTIDNSYAKGNVDGVSSGVGGLVGSNSSNSSAIRNSYATGDVSDTAYQSNTFAFGGLVGDNYGTVTTSYATGNTQAAFGVGGLVGFGRSSSSVTDSYATGNVTGKATSGGNYATGGLIGDSSGAITTSYAAGAAGNATGSVLGGLVGNRYSGTIQNSVWRTGTSCSAAHCATADVGAGSASGVTGLTDVQMTAKANYTARSWDVSTTVSGGTSKWVIYEGQTKPLLRSLLSSQPHPSSGSAETASTSTSSSSSGTTTPGGTGSASTSATVAAATARTGSASTSVTVAAAAVAQMVVAGGKASTSSPAANGTLAGTAAVLVTTGGKTELASSRPEESVAPPPKSKGRMLVCRKG